MVQAISPDVPRAAEASAPDSAQGAAEHASASGAVDSQAPQARVLLICCILAESFSPLPLRDLDIPAALIRHTVAVALRDTRPDYIFGWRSRVTAWSVRWDAARHAASTYFPGDLPRRDKIPGLDALDELDLTTPDLAQLTELCRA